MSVILDCPNVGRLKDIRAHSLCKLCWWYTPYQVSFLQILEWLISKIISLADRQDRKNKSLFLVQGPPCNFFSDPHVADHFLISFLGSLLPCGVAPTASAGQYLWNLPGSETASVWLLPLSPTVQCEWRPLFNSSAAASHGHQHQILPSPGLQGSPRELPFSVLSWTSIPVLWPTQKCAYTY